MSGSKYRGVLIEQSVDDPRPILRKATEVGDRPSKLEGESFRGTMRFINIEVSQDNLFDVLLEVASSIKSPGWYFHLVNERRLYIVMPSAILFADKGDNAAIERIVEYAVSRGIHRDQLDLNKLFDDAYA